MEFKLYDAVRLTAIRIPIPVSDSRFNLRVPTIGDVAYIIEIYSNPFGYELECSDTAGITQWMTSFSADDVEFDLVAR